MAAKYADQVELADRIVANEAKIGEARGMAGKAIDPAPLARGRVKRFVDDPGLSKDRPSRLPGSGSRAPCYVWPGRHAGHPGNQGRARPGYKGAGTAPLGREKLLMVAQFSLARGFAGGVVVAQGGAVRHGDAGVRRHDTDGRAAGDASLAEEFVDRAGIFGLGHHGGSPI